MATYFNLQLKVTLPDVTIGTKGKSFEKIYEVVNHELSHASHFSKVGDSFWAKYVSYIMSYGAYGDGTGRNAELCAIGEMWGYAMGCIAEKEIQGAPIVVNKFPYLPIDGWIKPHIFGDLYSANTLNKKQIFDCLGSSVQTYEELTEEMVYDPVGSEEYGSPRYVTYTTKSHGYYTMKYPDDVCCWYE